MKKIIKIIQHTPVIQHRPDEKGVLFSKQRFISALDRFIVKKMEESNLNLPPIWKSYGYFQDTPDNKSLNYRLDIKLGEQIIPRDIRSPLYFGNIGDGVKKAFTYSNREIELIFDRADEGLLDCIEKHIAEFLVKTTIGNRGSKGFGSFYIKTDKVFESIDKILDKHYYLEFDITGVYKYRVQDYIQNCINYHSKRLKSGLNHITLSQKSSTDREGKSIVVKDYQRAFLSKYINKYLKTHWEKRWIKEKKIIDFTTLRPQNYDKVEAEATNPAYVRLLLGMPENFVFNSTNKRSKIIEITETQTVSLIHQAAENNKIERVPSPILYKPIISENTVRIYLIINLENTDKILSENNHDRTFKVKGNEMNSIDLPKSFNTLDLIDKYHSDELKNTFEFIYSQRINNENQYTKVPTKIIKTSHPTP